MSKPSNSLAPDRVIRRILEFADHALERAIAENHHRVSCVRGCDFCCRQPVFVTPLEALAVSIAVDRMDTDTKARVERQIDNYGKTLTARPEMSGGVEATAMALSGLGDGPTKSQFVSLYGPACPFLVDHECSVYDSRPLMCREHTSLDDPGKCERDEPFYGLPAALFNEVPASLCSDLVPDEMLFLPVWEYAVSAKAALALPPVDRDFLDQILSWKLQALGLDVDKV